MERRVTTDGCQLLAVWQVVTVLLKGGANKNQTNANGQMPEQMAELLQDKTAEEAVLRALNE